MLQILSVEKTTTAPIVERQPRDYSVKVCHLCLIIRAQNLYVYAFHLPKRDEKSRWEVLAVCTPAAGWRCFLHWRQPTCPLHFARHLRWIHVCSRYVHGYDIIYSRNMKFTRRGKLHVASAWKEIDTIYSTYFSTGDFEVRAYSLMADLTNYNR